jgi:GNAT superfamily N-acetyltransferase
MYVVPAARGQGVARTLLHELERTALELGYPVARLDTGPEAGSRPGAVRSEGYEAVEDFNGNPVAVFWGEKRLARGWGWGPGPSSRRQTGGVARDEDLLAGRGSARASSRSDCGR